MACIITDVRIEGFRSIRRVDLLEIDEYVPLIGLNSSGKSNILRALSLFFDGVVDEGRTGPSIAVDYPSFALRKKAKKRIAVALSFDMTGQALPKSLDRPAQMGGIRRFVIERFWTLAPNRAVLVDEFRIGADHDSLVVPDDHLRQYVLAFVQGFQFRYVPNHVRPADFIQTEVQALRSKLLNRLRKTKAFRDGGVDSTMEALAKVASGMFDELSTSVARGSDTTIQPDIPSDFAELVFQVGIQAVTASGDVQTPAAQGSGTQSFILLHVLSLLDSTLREQGFGWKQFMVWGVEEPESFLHAGLRTQFAEDLRGFAEDRRRQIFVTTHQDEFVRVADNAWLVELGDGETSVAGLPARDALETSSRLRISSYSHPLMSFVDFPVVIVEGKWDATYLRWALARSKRRPRWRLVTLSEIDSIQSGGDNVRAYLQANRSVLASRPLASPVFVLRDWEDTKVESIDKLVRKAHENSRAWRCPSDLCNTDLGKSFRGIERYLSAEHVEAVVGPENLSGANLSTKYPLEIDGSVFESMKPKLAARTKQRNPSPAMIALAEWLDDEVQRVFGDLPPNLFT